MRSASTFTSALVDTREPKGPLSSARTRVRAGATPLVAILVGFGSLGCRRDEAIETPAPTPKVAAPKPAKSEPPPVKPIALELSASGGCTLDSAGDLWCWGGHATRHPGLRSDVADTELLVATRVASRGVVRDFAVADTGVCWVLDDGVVQCHFGEGIERYALGDPLSLAIATYDDGRHAVVVQLDNETLHSNLWSEPRQYGALDSYDLAGSKLCVQLEQHQIVCDTVWSKYFGGGDVSGNAFTRSFAIGPSTMCRLENSGVVDCTPPFAAMALNTKSRWIEGIDDAISIDVGEHHACVLGADAKVVCFGGNGYFQRGEGIDGVAAVELPGPATLVAAAGQQSCAIVDDQVYCWGASAMGPDDRLISRNDIVLDSTALHVSGHFNCVSRPQATTIQKGESAQKTKVWCWGSPDAPALGWANAGIDGAAEPRPVALPMSNVDALFGNCFRWGERTACGSFVERGQWHAGVATEDFVDSSLFDAELPARVAIFTGFVGDSWTYCTAVRATSPLQCTTDRFANYLEAPPRIAEGPLKGPLVIGPDEVACTFTRDVVTCSDVTIIGRRLAQSTAFERVRALVAGEIGWFALDADGRVWMFEVGHEFDEDLLSITAPVLVPIADAVEIGVFAVDPELCARDAGGAIRCITRVEQGWSEARVELDHGALELDVGIAHACARVDDDGDGASESIHCWGDNRFAQLGTVGPHVVRTPTALTKR